MPSESKQNIKKHRIFVRIKENNTKLLCNIGSTINPHR